MERGQNRNRNKTEDNGNGTVLNGTVLGTKTEREWERNGIGTRTKRSRKGNERITVNLFFVKIFIRPGFKHSLIEIRLWIEFFI